MAKLFGVDLAAKFAKAFGPGKAFDGSLTKVTAGTRTPGNLTAGTNPATDGPYACRGYKGKDAYFQLEVGGDRVKTKAATVVIFQASLPSGIAPDRGDRIAIQGETWTIIEVGSDPAEATYRLVVR